MISSRFQVDLALWSPIGAFVPDAPSLVTLTDDHWLRIYSGGDDDFGGESSSFKLLADCSKIYLAKMKERGWSDCSKAMRGHRYHADKDNKKCKGKKTMFDFISRTLGLSLSCIAWCDLITEATPSGRYNKSLFVTADRLGNIHIWETNLPLLDKAEMTAVAVDVKMISESGVGPVSHMYSYKVAKDRNLLFVGGVSGQVRMLNVTWDGNERAKLTDYGFVWCQHDMAALGCILVASDTFLQDSSLVLLIAKEKYLLAVDLHIDDALCKVVLTKKRVAPVMTSRVVDLEPLQDRHKFLVALESGKPTVVDTSSDRLEPTSLEDCDLDCSVFKMSSLRISNGGALCVASQTVAVSHDHLVFRMPGRMTFLVQHGDNSLHSISQRLMSLESERLGLVKDSLVLFHLLAVSDKRDPKILDQIQRDLLKTDPPRGKRRLQVWLCKFFLKHFCSDGESRTKLETVLNQLCLKIFQEYAYDFLKGSELVASPEGRASGLASFLLRTKTNEDVVNEVAAMGYSRDYEWTCRLCGGRSAAMDYYQTICDQGHTWPMCVLSQTVCDCGDVVACKWCQAVARRDMWRRGDACTLCGGPLARP